MAIKLLNDLFGKSTQDTTKTKTELNLAKLYNYSDDAQLVYPNDLLTPGAGMGHFILFNINTIQGTRFKAASRRTENEVTSPYSSPVVDNQSAGSIRRSSNTRQVRSTESIALSMPSSITTNYGVQWQGSNLGVAGRVIRKFGSLDNINLTDAQNVLFEEGKKMLGGAVQAITPINAADANEFFTGTLSNPFVEVLFKGVNNREVSLQFKFTPREREESELAQAIIHRFKFHQHPEYKYKETDSAYFLHPSTFDLTFMYVGEDGNAQRNTWLHRLSTCALTNMSVDYTPDGEYNAHEDESPPAIVVNLSFIELEQLHKGRFESAKDTF